MLRLYLVRHGWTAWHSERRVAGWADVPLDARGQAEAAFAADWLARHCENRPLALLASPVLRARQTAEAIAGAWSPPLDVVVEHGIGETRIAEWEGRLVDEIQAEDGTWPQFFSGPGDFRFPGGETNREVQSRTLATVEALRRQYADGELILVFHADPLRGLLAHYLGMEVGSLYRLRVDTGSISRLSLPAPDTLDHAARPRLDFLNLTEQWR